MRRAKPISIVVKAPSRGLVTRLPTESADLLPTNSGILQATLLSSAAYQRASSAAQNVRYEDGVVCAAPGYQTIILDSALLNGIIAYWPLTEPFGTRFDATPNHRDLTDVPGTNGLDVISDPGILDGLAVLFPTSSLSQFFDSLSLDVSLSSGAYVQVLVFPSQQDSFSLDASLFSGQYSSNSIDEMGFVIGGRTMNIPGFGG